MCWAVIALEPAANKADVRFGPIPDLSTDERRRTISRLKGDFANKPVRMPVKTRFAF